MSISILTQNSFQFSWILHSHIHRLYCLIKTVSIVSASRVTHCSLNPGTVHFRAVVWSRRQIVHQIEQAWPLCRLCYFREAESVILLRASARGPKKVKQKKQKGTVWYYNFSSNQSRFSPRLLDPFRLTFRGCGNIICLFRIESLSSSLPSPNKKAIRAQGLHTDIGCYSQPLCAFLTPASVVFPNC